MTNERILEIARRYGTVQDNVQYVEFSREQIISFAQSVIEADRESSDEPVAWYDKHGMITHDPFEGVTPLYTCPAPARKPLSDEEIIEIARHELSILVFARAIEKAHGIGETE